MLSHRPQLSLSRTLHREGDDDGAPTAPSESLDPSIDSSVRKQTLHFGESGSESEDGTLDFLRPTKKQCGAPTNSSNVSDASNPLGTADPAPKTGLRPSLESVATARVPPAIVERKTPALPEAGEAQPLMKAAPTLPSASEGPASHAPAHRLSHLSQYFPPEPTPAPEKNDCHNASTTEKPECPTHTKESSSSQIQATSQGVPSGTDFDIGASFISEQSESNVPEARLSSKRCTATVPDVSPGSFAPAVATTYGGAAALPVTLQKPRSDGLPTLRTALSSGTVFTGVDSRLREPRIIEARQPMRPESSPMLSRPSDLTLASAPASTITFPAPSPSPPFSGSLLPRATNPLLLASRRAIPIKPTTPGVPAPAATARFSASSYQGCVMLGRPNVMNRA